MTGKTVNFPSDARRKEGERHGRQRKERPRGPDGPPRYDILKNHDQEMSTIEAQIDAERAALEEDLEAIRARAYPRGVRYDTPRVQSSPDPDGLLVKVADAIQRRTARTKRATDALEERQRQSENVHEAILTMDAKSKIILLTLYYPRRTYAQAAELLDMDVSTVSRQRKTAVDRLVGNISAFTGISNEPSRRRKTFAHDCTSLHKSAHNCTCNGYKSVRKCYKGTLPSSRTSFFIGRRKERLRRRSFSVARKGRPPTERTVKNRGKTDEEE